ncbi:MAG: class I SAM-dependent methyltransferase [Zoogloeaceae bacterium]|nr:class I SAM-dependent methyltransferase [Rhodocyclaceae bacterium]MCP5221686.1 class I SAM-dependent methyltransferase [Zoogloeaceae bacterium]
MLDLGCGQANQPGLVARLSPDMNFVGVDLSPEILDRGRHDLNAHATYNVSLNHGNITALTMLGAADVDAVMSTMVLHHLPDEQTLFRCFSEVRRVLKPGADYTSWISGISRPRPQSATSPTSTRVASPNCSRLTTSIPYVRLLNWTPGARAGPDTCTSSASCIPRSSYPIWSPPRARCVVS